MMERFGLYRNGSLQLVRTMRQPAMRRQPEDKDWVSFAKGTELEGAEKLFTSTNSISGRL